MLSRDLSILMNQFGKSIRYGDAALRHLQRAVVHTRPFGTTQLAVNWSGGLERLLTLNCRIHQSSFQTTTNQDETAESVMIAGLFILSPEMVELASLLHPQIANRSFDVYTTSFYSEKIALMENVVWEAGWDGAWFRRAYDANGAPIGSNENEEGKILLNLRLMRDGWQIVGW